MPTTIKIKSSTVPSKAPDPADLVIAELAVNLADRKLYTKDGGGAVVQLGVAEVELGYTPESGQGTVTNTAGADAVIPLADGTNAGLLAPGDKDKLDDISVAPGGGLEIAGYIKTDDGGTQQNITGGGGLDVVGDISLSGSVQATVNVQADGVSATGAGFSGTDLSLTGGAILTFGTSTAQVGNVAPLNDWSCYPARV